MAPKEILPRIRKSKRATKVMESSEEVVIVDAGIIGGKSVASEFTEDDIDAFLEKSGLPISKRLEPLRWTNILSIAPRVG